MSETSYSMLSQGITLQNGRYRIEGHLASGGFGNTYLVQDLRLDVRRVAKEFFMRGINQREVDGTVSVSNHDNRDSYNRQKDKFMGEARRLARFNNPHIVHVHDFFEENGTAYYIMDYVDGCSLSALLSQRTDESMTEAEVRPILNQILDALQAVHAQRDDNGRALCHLDLKPGNIMLDKQAGAVLIDFGASKQIDPEGSGNLSTSSAMAFTPGYAPPEQVQQNLAAIGPWTDFYALGATLYKLLTGQKPPSSDDIINEGTAIFAFPPSVSVTMRRLIMTLMDPRRKARPQNVDEVRSLIGQPSVQPQSPSISNTEETIVEDATVRTSAPKAQRIVEPRPTTQNPLEQTPSKKRPWHFWVMLIVTIWFFLATANAKSDADLATGFVLMTLCAIYWFRYNTRKKNAST